MERLQESTAALYIPVTIRASILQRPNRCFVKSPKTFVFLISNCSYFLFVRIIVPMSPPSINGTVLHQLCYAIWLSKIFISCVKTDSLWSLTQAVQRFTTSHQHSLSWLHLGASCFTATLHFESGCLMLLGGEELFSAKSCKRPYWLCLVSYGLFRFKFFLFLQQSHHTQQCWRGTVPDCKSLLAASGVSQFTLLVGGRWMWISSLGISCWEIPLHP